jgi:hypothetical protein
MSISDRMIVDDDQHTFACMCGCVCMYVYVCLSSMHTHTHHSLCKCVHMCICSLQSFLKQLHECSTRANVRIALLVVQQLACIQRADQHALTAAATCDAHAELRSAATACLLLCVCIAQAAAVPG